MADAFLSAWQQQIARRLKTQPKKTMALSILVAVMAVMWGKVLFTGKTQPAVAMANLAGSKANTEAAVANSQSFQATRALQEFTRSSVGLIHRNLFLVKLDYFTQDGSSLTKDQSAADGFWDELAKSFAAKADQEKVKHILVENLQSQAARLKLQSTVMKNGDPKAMVNGTLVGAGDTIAGFRVVKIEAKRIIVEREGIKLEVVFRF
jgi:hypothetical protein